MFAAVSVLPRGSVRVCILLRVRQQDVTSRDSESAHLCGERRADQHLGDAQVGAALQGGGDLGRRRCVVQPDERHVIGRQLQHACTSQALWQRSLFLKLSPWSLSPK